METKTTPSQFRAFNALSFMKSLASKLLLFIIASATLAVFWHDYWVVRNYSNVDDCWTIILDVAHYRNMQEYSSAHSKLKLYRSCMRKFNAGLGMRYYYHLGWLQHEEGKYEKAKLSYLEGLKSQANYPFAYWRIGLAEEKLGNKAKAEENYKRAYEIGIEISGNEFLESLEKYPEIKQNLTKHLKEELNKNGQIDGAEYAPQEP